MTGYFFVFLSEPCRKLRAFPWAYTPDELQDGAVEIAAKKTFHRRENPGKWNASQGKKFKP